MHHIFNVGKAVSSQELVDRKGEIRRLKGCITESGQSAALVGEPRTGKTSLLHYLMAAETRQDLYGEAGARLRFQYLDAQALGGGFDAPKFWGLALMPIEELVKSEPGLQPAYGIACQEKFGTFVLERLFTQLQVAGWRLVLLVDEFDSILHLPLLNQSEFYGGLRSLASRFSSLSLVIAARQSLSDLNRLTQDFSRAGSPYFNIYQQIDLGAFKEKDALELLARGEAHFSRGDKTYLLRLAGGHPFLLQAAASALWSAYEDGEKDARLRYQQAGKDLFQQAAPTLQDTWRLWPPEMKKAFTIIALDNLPRLLGERKFDLDALIKSLADYTPELRSLETRGYIAPDAGPPGTGAPSGYAIQAEVMLWWLAEELIQALRRQDDLGAWLRAEGWEGLLKRGEKDALLKAARDAGNLLKPGLDALIKAAAERLGKVVAG